MDVFTTKVPARLDRLPWARFHWLVVIALGATWILDGLEVTLVGSLSGAIEDSPALQMNAAAIGLAASAYIAGAVLGALVFGYLTDRLGRKKLFTITVGVYLVATVLTGLSWSFWSFALFRFLTGMGIGGEYSAINSAVQEFVPARRRGFTDLVINGSYWIGAAIGALGSVVVLDPRSVSAGSRLAFRLYHRRIAGAAHHLLPPFPSREPALADDPWPAGRGRCHRRVDRGRRGGGTRHGTDTGRACVHPPESRPSPDCRQCRPHALRTLSPPRRARRHADGDPGVLLQRHLLHLCADPDAISMPSRRAISAGSSCPLRSEISPARSCWAISSTASAARR